MNTMVQNGYILRQDIVDAVHAYFPEHDGIADTDIRKAYLLAWLGTINANPNNGRPSKSFTADVSGGTHFIGGNDIIDTTGLVRGDHIVAGWSFGMDSGYVSLASALPDGASYLSITQVAHPDFEMFQAGYFSRLFTDSGQVMYANLICARNPNRAPLPLQFPFTF